MMEVLVEDTGGGVEPTDHRRQDPIKGLAVPYFLSQRTKETSIAALHATQTL